MSTIRDVAASAGVSVATVSRVINDNGPVSESTRYSVLKAVTLHSYRPNLLGRNLRRTETRMILVLLPTIANPFYAKIVKGIEDAACKRGYNILLCNTDEDIKRENMYLELLNNRLADGVIFFAPQMEKEELTLIGSCFPVVQCCEYKEGADVSHVSIDNFKAAHKAVKYLIDSGHSKIALISCGNRFVSTQQRELGYMKALAEAGIPYLQEYVRYGDYSFDSGFDSVGQLLAKNEKPTAIFAISDMMAVGAVKAVKDKGLSIPGDVAVIGFDDVSFASMCDPSLTTVSQPKYDLGRTAMELLLKQIKTGSRAREDIFLDHELIIRDSTNSK